MTWSRATAIAGSAVCEDPMRASGGQGRVSLVDRKTSRRIEMTQFARPTPAAADYDSTIIGALELSEKKWVLAVHLAVGGGSPLRGARRRTSLWPTSRALALVHRRGLTIA